MASQTTSQPACRHHIDMVSVNKSTSPGESTPTMKQRDDVRKACMADVMRLCAREASARDRQGVRTCLKANFSKTSQACQTTLRNAAGDRETQGSSSRPRSSDRSSTPAPKP
eukprot:gene33095-55670_t